MLDDPLFVPWLFQSLFVQSPFAHPLSTQPSWSSQPLLPQLTSCHSLRVPPLRDAGTDFPLVAAPIISPCGLLYITSVVEEPKLALTSSSPTIDSSYEAGSMLTPAAMRARGSDLLLALAALGAMIDASAGRDQLAM